MTIDGGRSAQGRGSKITLAGIARRAGVSTATVSKVLNGRADVAAETRARVQALLDAYGYSGRAGPRPSILDVIMVRFNDAWAAGILTSFDEVARRHGLEVVPTATMTHEVTPEHITRILSRGTRGVVSVFSDVSPELQSRIHAARVPLVVVAQATEPAPDTSAVMIDFRAGIRSATQHMIDSGHRRIGLVVGARGMDYTEQRIRGYGAALRSAGLPYISDLVRCCWYDDVEAESATTELLARPDRPTAIIAGSDTIAIGVYRAAEATGLAIGRDLAVVGFDGRPEAQWLKPPLSTVVIPVHKLAEHAIDLLFHAEVGDRRRQVGGNLVVRESSRSDCQDVELTRVIEQPISGAIDGVSPRKQSRRP